MSAQVLGRYELLRPIARGGMATVYLGRMVGEGGFERRVAIKLMHPHIADDQEFVAMFLDEARIAARIRHPNVVSTLEVDRSSEGLFLVLELVEGHSLHALLRHAVQVRNFVPLDVGVRIALDLLEGLHAAHEVQDDEGVLLHLVHRDVSPQNVLVGKDGVSRITDFGVAHARARLATTQGSSLKGKVAYLSPEQLTGLEVDRRSDVFAAGIVIWEMLVGRRRLFRGRSEGETIAAILSGNVPVASSVNPEIPPSVDKTLERALAFDAQARYATAVEFADALTQAMADAGRAIAHPRAVATFIDALDVPAAQGALLPATQPTHASSHEPSNATGSAASPLVASLAPAAPRRRWLVATVAGACALALAIGGWLSLRGTPLSAPESARSASAAQATPAASVSVTPVASIAKPEVSAAPSVTAAPVASSVPDAPRVPTTATTKRSPAPQAKPRPTATTPSPTTYRPDEL